MGFKYIGFEMARQLATGYEGYHILIGSGYVKRGVKAAEVIKSNLKFGRLDILINDYNAGIRILDSFTEPSTRTLFEKTSAVNTVGAAATTADAIPSLKYTGARLVFVSSSSELGSLAMRSCSVLPLTLRRFAEIRKCAR
ncbi:hypothetical protein B0H11DRAFT_884587 [Mycena galericulata]|nr:hypothetical protein B0H11DRAFT_884587 [Mycena galericulata]